MDDMLVEVVDLVPSIKEEVRISRSECPAGISVDQAISSLEPCDNAAYEALVEAGEPEKLPLSEALRPAQEQDACDA
jgi:hypothetical protein